MKIGELARAADTRVETIRFYEREGLLGRAGRTSSNYRIYAAGDAERLHFIRRCRSLDMTLPEIRQLLAARDAPASSCDAVNGLIDEHIGHVAARIRELKDLQRQLKSLRARCAQPDAAQHCGILQGLADDALPVSRDAAEGHVAGAHGSGTHQR
jgi:Cd(II)/Pb(II)-responsive transcriptional regulator